MDFETKEKLNSVTISSYLQHVAHLLKLKGHYTSHSLRAGGASEAAAMGFQRAMIQLMGDWTSNAIDNYFRLSKDKGMKLTSAMGFGSSETVHISEMEGVNCSLQR